MKTLASILLLMIAAVACAQLGLPTPQTPEQKILAGYATADSVNRSATTLLNAKKISSADAQHVLESTRGARQGLDIARQLAKVDPKAADSKLQAQMLILKALQDYLAAKGG